MPAFDRTWLAKFDEEIEFYFGDDTVESLLASELKACVLDQDCVPAAPMARRIQDIYQNEYLPADPLTKYLEDKGMELFLTNFYDIIYKLARLVPYTTSTKERLIDITFELRKLPPLKVKIWDEDFLVWTGEPFLGYCMDSSWNNYYPNELSRKGGDPYSFEEKCQHWINFSHYVALCTARGADFYKWRLKYPSIDIPQALDENTLSPGPKLDCEIMVAAHHILLTGNILAAEERFKPEEWRRWATKLARVSKGEGTSDTSVISVAGQAYAYIVELFPKIF